MSIFKTKKEKNAKAKLDMIHGLASRNKTIETLVEKGLLSYDTESRRLFVSSMLATFFLDSEERWKAFLQNVYNWILLKRQEKAWDNFFREIELKAVREAKKKYLVLSKLEIQNIRQKARESVDVSDMEPPKIESFEFFITDIAAPKEPVIAIGKYDGDNFTISRYEDVKRFIQKKEKP